MIELTDQGLYCPAADFYIDPWRPVARAIITHGHADHARAGSQHYFAHQHSEALLRHRLGKAINFTGMDYGQPSFFNGIEVSLHSAGHILGSAQVRISDGKEVWVASGDYKRDAPSGGSDPSCAPFEVVPCDTFITEATFALPIYHWPDINDVVSDIYQWWQSNAKLNKASVLFCYSLGKAQRILSLLEQHTSQTVLLHGAVTKLTEIYRQTGIAMLPTAPALADKKTDYAGELIIAPPGANGTPWMKRFGDCSTGFCSGWMLLRGNRRRKGYDRGFVISDHADWPGLLQTIEECGAKKVLATHGRTDVLVRFLRERSIEAHSLKTFFSDESLDESNQNDEAVA